MLDELVFEVQRLYPQIYLACHVDHVRSVSTQWKLSSRDSSILSHLGRDYATSPRELAGHLGVASSTLSATIARLERLGYIRAEAGQDRRTRELRLTPRGAEAMSSTSVLDTTRVRAALERLTESEREEVVRGLALLARAARKGTKS
jgi:DNA-binding MarR family transcriptional regulator